MAESPTEGEAALTRLDWVWPDDPVFKGGNPRKALLWDLVLTLHSGDHQEVIEVTTDGPLKLPEVYLVVRQHIDEFRTTVGPLTGAHITGTGRKTNERKKR